MKQILAIGRILAALPLLGIGVMHLTGQAPLLPILEGASMPMAEMTAKVAPVVMVLAGVMLLVGVQARLGALLGVLSMAGALAGHLRFDHANFEWADEPPIVLPIVVLVLCLLVLAKGAGAWTLGKKGGG